MLVARIRSKIQKIAALSLACGFVMASLLAPLPAFAAGPSSTGGLANKEVSAKDDAHNCRQPYAKLNKDNCDIIMYLVVLTNILSALVGVVIVISITWAGIQYSMAKSDPQAVVAARSRITNSILALVVYIFMVAFLQWVVPGGVF